ncbi:MAG: fused MFS/spermidine synthase [Proteobacteria bacterium]|nr:fused MFS/spermidine synthase [Pseudomonadota bacterium]
MAHPRRISRWSLWTVVLLSGVCGLTWEVLWQHHTSLALGVSAFGTALTLASLMAGLGLGGLLAARLARGPWLRRPLAAYGAAELAIGAGGIFVPLGLGLLGDLDTALYARSPALAGGAQILGTALLLLVPATAMGATIPILAPYAARVGTGVAAIYALNVTGAVAGVLLATFVSLPLLGVDGTGLVTAALNVAVAVWAFAQRGASAVQPPEPWRGWPSRRILWLAGSTGFAIFVLEVSWFRSLRALLQSTTESFAVILATFLLALALGGALATRLRRRAHDFSAIQRWIIPLAALGIVCATPAIDSLDHWALAVLPGWAFSFSSPAALSLRFALVFAVVAVPITLLGVIFPWLLAENETTGAAGRLYAVNTVGAVAGALLAGFVLLPWLGATVTSWIAGGAVLANGALGVHSRARALPAVAAAALAVLVIAGTGSPGARLRARGLGSASWLELLFLEEGPDNTVSVVRNAHGRLALVIDGFVVSGEGVGSEYMEWMGHLPAMAAPRLENALVICFGIGQTANAVRRHRPGALHLVDVNEAVFAAADLFESNQGVLDDEVVRQTVMDGRAFLRRVDARYDVVTLEPMAPNFAGTNNLYSREFYELIRERLAPDGVVAQWLPFHLIAPSHMRAMVAAFHAVFPYTRLWIAPGTTGILIGGPAPWELRPSEIDLPLSQPAIERRFALDYEQLETMVAGWTPVTDDNQLLAYGYDRLRRPDDDQKNWSARFSSENQMIIRRYRRGGL